MQPETRYAKSGDVHIAYQVFGKGPVNLVLVPAFVSNIELYWEHPDTARWMLRLANFARVATFDKRGTGLSDRVSESPSFDLRMDDARAVMDAAGMERAAILGISEGGSMAALFAATYPQRCQGLVIYGGFARPSWTTVEGLEGFFRYVEKSWGSGHNLSAFAPSRKNDRALQQFWGRFERLSASPAAVTAVVRMLSQIDISDILSSIHVPTLVIHCTGDTLVNVECGRFLAEQIPGARLLELPGSDHLFFIHEQIGDAIEEFLTGSITARKRPRPCDRSIHRHRGLNRESRGAGRSPLAQSPRKSSFTGATQPRSVPGARDQDDGRRLPRRLRRASPRGSMRLRNRG